MCSRDVQHHSPWLQLQAGYEGRKAAIQRCVDLSKQKVQQLKREKESTSSDDLNAVKRLRAEQTKVNEKTKRCALFKNVML